MLGQRRSLFLLMLAFSMTAGCAGSRQAATPAAGAWSYTISTPDGPYDGTLTLEGQQEALRGTLVSAAEDGRAYELQNVVYEDPTLTFQIDHPQYGKLAVEASVAADVLRGTVDVPGYGKMPLHGTRSVE